MMQRFKFRRDEGTEIAEVAVILPIVIMFLLAILWFGRAFNIYSTITHAAREGAMVAVQQNCATCTGSAPTVSDVAAKVGQVLQAASIDPSNIRPYTPTPAPRAGGCGGMTTTTASNITLYTNAQLNAVTSNPPACGVVVSFEYPFTFFLPSGSSGRSLYNLRLKAVAQTQGEN